MKQQLNNFLNIVWYQEVVTLIHNIDMTRQQFPSKTVHVIILILHVVLPQNILTPARHDIIQLLNIRDLV